MLKNVLFYSKSVRERLGEKNKQKRSRNNRQSTTEDDIEIMPETYTHTQANGTTTNSETYENEARGLKCPITKMLFEHPVRSKVCGHIYDLKGLEQMWKAKRFQCPVPGCSNTSVKKDQLEDDEEMKMKVRSYLRRVERMKEENVEEDHIGIGMTVVS